MICGEIQGKHVFDGANNHPFNSFTDGSATFPEGHTCMCGKTVWHNKTADEKWQELQEYLKKLSDKDKDSIIKGNYREELD